MANQDITLNDQTFVFETVMRVRNTEIDVGQFLSMQSMMALLTEAKARFFYSKEIKDVNAEFQGPILTSMTLQFPTRVRAREELLFEVGVEKITKEKGVMLFKVSRMFDGSLVAKARASFVNFDYRRNENVYFSDDVLELLQYQPFEV